MMKKETKEIPKIGCMVLYKQKTHTESEDKDTDKFVFKGATTTYDVKIELTGTPKSFPQFITELDIGFALDFKLVRAQQNLFDSTDFDATNLEKVP